MNKTILLILMITLMTGCSSRTSAPLEQAGNIPVNPIIPPTQLEPAPVPLAIATGWNEVTIIANSARTKISTGAHFTTTRNACGHEAYGGVTLDDWNKLGNALNLAVQKRPLTEAIRDEYCVSIPDSPPYMDGSVDVKTNEGLTQNIYQLKGDQICSSLQDTKVSDDLLSAITKIIAAADKEDCPNGWGSN